MLAHALFTAALLPAMPTAAAEPDCFGNLMCTIPLARGDHPHEWPFSIETGELSCVTLGAERAVFFAEEDDDDYRTIARQVIVTTNPLALLATIEDRELYAPYADNLETLIKRLAPYQDIGLAICPSGSLDKDI